MKKRINLLSVVVLFSTVLFLALTTTSCKKEEEAKVFDMVAAQQAIDEANTIFADAFTKGDAVALAGCYTADAKFMPPNAKASEGNAAIQEEMSNFFKGGTVKLEIKSIGLWGDENMLTEENTWATFDKDGNELDHGKSLVSYKKEGDKWKIFRDCYNSDTNGEAPTPETEPVAEENK
jgi:ketosteroid isomerase-like protein